VSSVAVATSTPPQQEPPCPLAAPPHHAPSPTTVAKARVTTRGRVKVRTMSPVALATIAGAPRRGPPNTIHGPAPYRCDQECFLRSSSRHVHRSRSCLLHRHTMVPPVALPLHPCWHLHHTSYRAQPLPGHPRQACGINSHWSTFFSIMTSNYTTSDVDNLTSVRPPTSTDTSSIIVGNESTLLVISVRDSALPNLFYLNNVPVTPNIIQNLLSIHCFTTDNWCSMEFDQFCPFCEGSLYGERDHQVQ
jgi:hypothetical protein